MPIAVAKQQVFDDADDIPEIDMASPEQQPKVEEPVQDFSATELESNKIEATLQTEIPDQQEMAKKKKKKKKKAQVMEPD